MFIRLPARNHNTTGDFMKPVLSLCVLLPLLTTGCIVYDSETPDRGSINETATLQTDPLAWLTPDSAIIGSTEIYSLQGDFDYEAVEELSFDGPSNPEIVTMTPRDDEILVVIGLDGQDVTPGDNDLIITFRDGSAFYVPSVFTVIAPQ